MKHNRYVVAVGQYYWGDPSITEEEHDRLAAAMQQALETDGWDVVVRRTWHGEAEGTYRQQANGDLQILGYSNPVPDDLEDALNRAWEQACETALTD